MDMVNLFLMTLAQTLESKWQLGNDTPSTSDKVESAPADDADELQLMIDEYLEQLEKDQNESKV